MDSSRDDRYWPDERREINGPAVCLWTLPPETIKTVYLGYGYDASNVANDIVNLTRYGATPEFYLIQVNRDTGFLGPNLIQP